MRIKRNFAVVLCVLATLNLSAQSDDDRTRAYFDFFTVGTWVSQLTILDGDTIFDPSEYKIRRADQGIAFEEDWKLHVGGDEWIHAHVHRAFDQETKSWKLYYQDDLYAQFWDSEVINGIPYFKKAFQFDKISFLSRISWVLDERGVVIRKIERSMDEGASWSLRYFIELAKK